MFTIIICEDEKAHREQLKKYLGPILNELEVLHEFIEYETGEQLLNNYSQKAQLIFLDIQMGKLTGMETARRIREIDEEIDIIFLSGSASYMQEGYEVNAKRYLTKPISAEEFRRQVKPCIQTILKKQEEYIWIKSGYASYKLLVHDILYAETYGRKVNIHTRQKIYDTHISLGQIEKRLDKEQFFRCHRGYLVNLQYIEGIEKEYLIIAGNEVPISRFKVKDLKKALAQIIGE
nr:LytTR family DNA-binding domain-containing protein [uncultured Cellulosilyticum sp.]